MSRMTERDAVAFGHRAVRTGLWRRWPGMMVRFPPPTTASGGGGWVRSLRVADDGGAREWPTDSRAWPDFTDPITAHMLAPIVRDEWGIRTLHIAPDRTRGTEAWKVVDYDGSGPDGLHITARTEVGAWVAALECAARRKAADAKAKALGLRWLAAATALGLGSQMPASTDLRNDATIECLAGHVRVVLGDPTARACSIPHQTGKLPWVVLGDCPGGEPGTKPPGWHATKVDALLAALEWAAAKVDAATALGEAGARTAAPDEAPVREVKR